MIPSSEWRRAAVDRWYDAQDHVGQADTDPEPYVEAAADAAVLAVLKRLRMEGKITINDTRTLFGFEVL
jgi:hypothetical protein